jgi:hypothetical protein
VKNLQVVGPFWLTTEEILRLRLRMTCTETLI